METAYKFRNGLVLVATYDGEIHLDEWRLDEVPEEYCGWFTWEGQAIPYDLRNGTIGEVKSGSKGAPVSGTKYNGDLQAARRAKQEAWTKAGKGKIDFGDNVDYTKRASASEKRNGKLWTSGKKTKFKDATKKELAAKKDGDTFTFGKFTATKSGDKWKLVGGELVSTKELIERAWEVNKKNPEAMSKTEQKETKEEAKENKTKESTIPKERVGNSDTPAQSRKEFATQLAKNLNDETAKHYEGADKQADGTWNYNGKNYTSEELGLVMWEKSGNKEKGGKDDAEVPQGKEITRNTEKPEKKDAPKEEPKENPGVPTENPKSEKVANFRRTELVNQGRGWARGTGDTQALSHGEKKPPKQEPPKQEENAIESILEERDKKIAELKKKYDDLYDKAGEGDISELVSKFKEEQGKIINEAKERIKATGKNSNQKQPLPMPTPDRSKYNISSDDILNKELEGTTEDAQQMLSDDVDALKDTIGKIQLSLNKTFEKIGDKYLKANDTLRKEWSKSAEKIYKDYEQDIANGVDKAKAVADRDAKLQEARKTLAKGYLENNKKEEKEQEQAYQEHMYKVKDAQRKFNKAKNTAMQLHPPRDEEKAAGYKKEAERLGIEDVETFVNKSLEKDILDQQAKGLIPKPKGRTKTSINEDIVKIGEEIATMKAEAKSKQPKVKQQKAKPHANQTTQQKEAMTSAVENARNSGDTTALQGKRIRISPQGKVTVSKSNGKWYINGKEATSAEIENALKASTSGIPNIENTVGMGNLSHASDTIDEKQPHQVETANVLKLVNPDKGTTGFREGKSYTLVATKNGNERTFKIEKKGEDFYVNGEKKTPMETEKILSNEGVEAYDIKTNDAKIIKGNRNVANLGAQEIMNRSEDGASFDINYEPAELDYKDGQWQLQYQKGNEYNQTKSIKESVSNIQDILKNSHITIYDKELGEDLYNDSMDTCYTFKDGHTLMVNYTKGEIRIDELFV